MGFSKLNIWITELGKACKIDKRTWYVNIYTCDGSILEWCGKRYSVLPARCGHLEIDVPPGCYLINAVWGYWTDPKGVIHGNHFTHNAVVQACCSETSCVTLFTPVNHICGVIFQLAVKDLAMQELVPKEVVQRFNVAIAEVLKYMPKPIHEFELGILEELDAQAKKPVLTEEKEKQ
jgi:hypothetical protein